MNIPYYYNSGYDEDGVNIYTCLNCEAKIYVRDIYKPNFCSYCGVKYAGKKENIGKHSKCWYEVCFTEIYYWAIEERYVEIWGEPLTEHAQWKEKDGYRWSLNKTYKEILAEKRRYEKECQEDIRKAMRDFNEDNDEILISVSKGYKNVRKKGLKRILMSDSKEYRIVRKKGFMRNGCVVRKDIYLKKTGKEFNEHKNRISYGTKAEITTGVKFLPDRILP